MATSQLSLKLLIDTKSKKVLFAEAGKDVVDFLFSLLSMPIGSVIKLLTKQKMVGCIGSLYKSVESLDETYFESNHDKGLLLSPSTASPSKNTLFLTEASSTTSAAKKFYRCFGGCKSIYTDVYGTRCPANCGYQMTVEMRGVGPNSGTVAGAAAATGQSGGFVKGVVTYTVMDDLTVTPMSTISSITMLNKFNVKDVGSLEERTVNLGMKEVSKIANFTFHLPVCKFFRLTVNILDFS